MSQKCDISKFLNIIENVITLNGWSPFIAIGDSNIDFFESISDDFSNLLLHYDFKNRHTLVTRPSSGKSIDNMFSHLSIILSIGSVECDLSDHNVICCRLENCVQSFEHFDFAVKCCDYNKLTENFRNNLRNISTVNNPSADTSN